MKIIQILPTLSYGDAIGNHVLALRKLISSMGYKTDIYAENIDARIPKGMGTSIEKLPDLEENDIVIYHLSTETKLNEMIGGFKGIKIIQYHNITPPQFFSKYNLGMKNRTACGLEQARKLAVQAEYYLADSTFNKNELIKMGYRQNIDVLPILINFEDYKQNASEVVQKRYGDKKKNLLFVGRVAPNKRQEDIIKAFFYYKKYMNSEARLFLVGNYGGLETYYERLKAYVYRLELQDVYFTGHISFDEILAYYKIADLFVCMSEHEGFCVPLLEAMYFHVPVLAYDSSAVGETMGDGGVLLHEKNPQKTALWMKEMLENTELRKDIINRQERRMKVFEYEKTSWAYRAYLEHVIEKAGI